MLILQRWNIIVLYLALSLSFAGCEADGGSECNCTPGETRSCESSSGPGFQTLLERLHVLRGVYSHQVAWSAL